MSDGAPPEPRPGTQSERTTLAWVRSALSLVGVGALLAKQSDSVVLAVPVLVTVAAVAVWMIARAERRHHDRGGVLEHGDPVVAFHQVAATTVAVTAMAAGSLLLVAA